MTRRTAQRWMIVAAMGTSLLLPGAARAQAGSSAQGDAADSGDGSFQRSVNPVRFRKGNPEWDTQEMIASGLTALHEEHVRILKEIEELKTAVTKLEKKQ